MDEKGEINMKVKFLKSKVFLVLSIILAVILVTGIILAVLFVKSENRNEKHYLEYQDNKSLIWLCINLSNSKKYDKQIKYIEQFMNKVSYDEFDKELEKTQRFNETQRKTCYGIVLTKYMSAFLHLNQTKDFPSAFEKVYRQYDDSREFYRYIDYSLSEEKLSRGQLEVILKSCKDHLGEENTLVKISNLNTQALLYGYCNEEEQMQEIFSEIDEMKNKLIEENTIKAK